ncbi:hypothetical protein GN244_ATG17668 [Phytophthora infestans]|uniref:Uncharacterized protein n=1 Tax=Phytophthora infestans TaxID=4787 RepID=A0A833RQE2_PHYIN|nr:hypothetical protein GN244_ATG17668 [Phytophthora infestans]
MSTTGFKGTARQQLTTVPHSEKGSEVNVVKRVQMSTSSAKGRQLHAEERLKVAMAERAMELQKLRHAIDETRRKRLDALATEKRMLKDIQEDEDELKRAQVEIALLKRQAAGVKNEVAATELEFDTEKQTFRLERQRLLTERYSVFHNNIALRRQQHVKSSKWKRISLEQNIVSFEQKKLLLDRIVEETNVKNLSEFIRKYNEQERTKAEVFARIEEQTATNAALNESIAQLTEDMARHTGAGEVDSTNNSEKPSAELQKVIDANEVHIKKWIKDAEIYAEAVKYLRDPIQDVYKEFYPNDRSEEVFDSTATREACMMRKIGAIEERIMQFIMAKILEETEASATPNNSDTLRRLRQYQGRQEQRDITIPSKACSVEPPSTLARGNIQRSKDTEDEEVDIDSAVKDVAVIHSEVFRRKFIAASPVITSPAILQQMPQGPPSSARQHVRTPQQCLTSKHKKATLKLSDFTCH